MFAGTLIESRGKISDGTNSAMEGITTHVKFFRNPSHVDRIVICTTPLASVLVAFIALMENECSITGASINLKIASDMKFVVAQVSRRARHLRDLFPRPEMYTIALVNNCGDAACESVAKLVISASCEDNCHSTFSLLSFVFVGGDLLAAL